MTKEYLKAKAPNAKRDLIVVSGYYGFDNLGDEAILEEIIAEVRKLSVKEEIVVLSANPQKTASLFGVQAIRRTDFAKLSHLLKRTKLFISGGGGLFQNTRTLGSIVFYGLQILLAKSSGCAVMIFAQGIGPLRGNAAVELTRRIFALADVVAVRDQASYQMLQQWQIEAFKTADPVWCLEAKALPQHIEEKVSSIATSKLVALSLRPSGNFTESEMDRLVHALSEALPANAHLLLVPLQQQQDNGPLTKFASRWQKEGNKCTLLDPKGMDYPSQWITLFGRCKMVVSMRLHALIMALKSGVPVVGLAYDPKVTHLLTDFEQPILNLTKESSGDDWIQTLKAAFAQRERLSIKAIKSAEGAKKLACQNFNLLDRILSMQSES